MQHFVYVVFDASNLTKVGMTSDLDRRMATYRTGSSSIQLAAALRVTSRECAIEIERLTHRILSYGREQSEWFSYSVETCIRAIEAAAQAWNKLMQVRFALVGWHPDDKKKMSPFVICKVERYSTDFEPPTQDDIDQIKISEAIESLFNFARNHSPAEFRREMAENFTEEDKLSVYRAYQWLTDFVAAANEAERAKSDE